MTNLVSEVNQQRGISEIQLIQKVIKSYNFIDYGLVQEYKNGIIKVKLCHKLMNKDINLTGIEVLSLGSKAFGVKYNLVKDDIVMLYSSKGFVATIKDFTVPIINSVDSYDIATIKAVALSSFDSAKNKLEVGDDGGFILTGEKYSIGITKEGEITLNNNNGNITMAINGTVTINGNLEILV